MGGLELKECINDFILRLLDSKVVRNAGWIIAGRIYHMALAFIIGLLSARYLGPSNFGLINYATTYTTFFYSLCTLGINSIIIKNFVDHPDEQGKTIGTAIAMRAVSSFMALLCILCLTVVLDKNETLTHWVVFLCSIGIVFQVFETINFWFEAQLKSVYYVVATSIAYTVVSIYKLYLLFTGKSVAWFAISTSIDYLIVAIVLVYAYIKYNGPRWSVELIKAKELFASGYHFILSGLMISIYNGTDRIMLKQMLDTAEVGYYSTAVSLCNIWTFVLSAIITSLSPGIIQAFRTNIVLFNRRNKQLYAIVIYLSAFVSLFLSLGSTIIVGVLYGQEYLPAALPLSIITWYTAFSYLGVAREPWIVCNESQCYLKYMYFGAAICNVVLNYVFIPVWGAAGAAFASLLTQISTIAVFPALIPRLRPNVRLMVDAVLLR